MLFAKVWTHSLFFTFPELKISKFDNVNTLSAQLTYPSKPNFHNLFEFPASKSTQYLPQFSSENCEINSIKSELSRAFQEHQEHPQIPIWFSVLILYNFHWENGSMINSFHIVAPNSLKPSQCTLLIKIFPKIPRAWHEAMWFGDLNVKQNKTNYVAS